MNILDTIFWFRKGKESVSVVRPDRKITTLKVENAKVNYIGCGARPKLDEISFAYDHKCYTFVGAEFLP